MTDVRPQRWALGVEYDGQCFHGWQTQGPAPHAVGERPAGAVLPTIQDALENALSQIADMPIQVICAGRTDAGVHATGQVTFTPVFPQRGGTTAPFCPVARSDRPYSPAVSAGSIGRWMPL